MDSTLLCLILIGYLLLVRLALEVHVLESVNLYLKVFPLFFVDGSGV